MGLREVRGGRRRGRAAELGEEAVDIALVSCEHHVHALVAKPARRGTCDLAALIMCPRVAFAVRLG